MTQYHGKDTLVLLKTGDVTGFNRGGSVSEPIDVADSTVLGLEDHTHKLGQSNGTVTLDGVFDTSHAATLDGYRKSTGEPFGLFPGGDTVGNFGRCSLIKQALVDISAPVGDIVRAQFQAVVHAGFDRGVSLHSTAAAETSATNGSTVDSGASSANGGAAYLWLTAFAGTDATIRVEHSTNGSTWATLTTFTTLTAVGSERLIVAEATTVNRYLRSVSAGTFTSITYAVAFGRR